MKLRLFIVILLALFTWSALRAAETVPAKPTARDRCPVCGMFVYKYPDWIVRIALRDGTMVFFDGVKDMFKYYLDIQKYGAKNSRADIASIFVTDYYGLTPVDGAKAFYILDSDIYGPMGKELIPFGKEAEAREFMKDHQGKRIIRFQDVTPSILKGLD